MSNVITILKDLISTDLKWLQFLLLIIVRDENSATSTFVETNKKEVIQNNLN